MSEPLPPGFIHDTYRRLKRISGATQKDGQPRGKIEISIDLNSKQITGTFSFPVTLEDHPELNAELIKVVDYAE